MVKIDYYQVLNVSRNASIDDIKKAYRSLALMYHPDRSGDEARFKEIAAAYEVLGDAQKRSLYNLQGFVGQRSQASPKPPKPSKQKHKSEKPFVKSETVDRNPKWDKDWQHPRNPPQHELDVITCAFFGPDNCGRSILIHLSVKPSELISGCTKTVKIKRKKLCFNCGGDGTFVTKEVCEKCGGTGIADFEQCKKCYTGKILGMKNVKCNFCEGSGLFPWEIVDIPIKVPANSRSGNRLIFFEGEDGVKGMMPGKLHVVLVESK